ncbi:urocanate reductase [Cetobacterium ceti]|uniref:Urocanate reductase n=1 Tax=Cetobacterium ceti TaxID=180163 RepID=A0A1T4M943_9FUSO|nr:flavocytochrome c [Cetobacterium ceti]SJZ63356.1 urocanate reductase [Cetobacterium ceti]
MRAQKKILLGLFSLCALNINGAEYKEGTYIGKANGYKGDIKVEVQLTKNKIKNISVISNGDTPIISDAPIRIIPKKILEIQGLGIDSVAGATGTSKGIIRAVSNAIKIGKGNIKDLRKIKEVKKEFSNKIIKHENDVVVIGAGGAGLIAAIEAKNNGANVVVIEKMEFPGGNTLISGGEYAAPENWIQNQKGLSDSKETFYKDIIKGGDNESDIKLAKVLAENALNGALWLRDSINVTFENRQMFFGGHSVERSLVPEGASGVELIKKLMKKAQELGIEVHLGTNGIELIRENNRVIGVKAKTETALHEYIAKNGVIIASGGFGSNLEMRKKYNSKMDEKILSTNTKGITGDGIILGENIGADTVDMEYIQTYPVCDPVNGSLLYTGDVRLAGSAILVNKEGKRFVEELERRDVISFAITEQTDGVGYLVWDQKQLDDTGVKKHHKEEYEGLIKRGILVKVNTLDEGAKHFNIDAKELKNSVEKYNGYTKTGKDLEFEKRGGLITLETPPYYILKVAPAIHHTMGGLVIDEKARVLDKKGKVIKGLYAAGEVTGDIHGKNRLGSNAIADITVFGRIAGKNIVLEK